MAVPVVLVDHPAPHVARLLINRPDKRNAIDHAVRSELMAALSTARGDLTIRALVFGGVGGVFSAGGDLPSMRDLDEEQARERMRHIHALCRRVVTVGLPIVSAIEGIGAGGAIGLALLGDHIVVGKGTSILFPFLKLGLTPDWGQLLTLPRRVGLLEAYRLLTSGVPVTGPDALRLRLADTLVADSEIMATAVAQAAALALLPRDALVRMTVRLKQPSGSLAEELEREENDQAVCLRSTEFAEGYGAFVAKRPPDFTGL